MQHLFQLQSPMFTMDSLSPTFRIGLSGKQAQVDDVKQAGGNKPPSTKSILDTAASTPRTMPDGLSPMTKANEFILTSKSTEMQNRMIDEQLEMLGELFPNQLKKLSNSQDQQAVETTITDSQVAHDSLSSGASSDFQDSPKTGRLALSSDWPKLADIEGDDSSTKRDSAGSSNTHVDPSTMHEVPSDIPLSPEKPLIERRSLAPTLRVDTVNSQQYATKELVLIRKMKEEGRVKSEIKVSSGRFHISHILQDVKHPLTTSVGQSTGRERSNLAASGRKTNSHASRQCPRNPQSYHPSRCRIRTDRAGFYSRRHRRPG